MKLKHSAKSFDVEHPESSSCNCCLYLIMEDLIVCDEDVSEAGGELERLAGLVDIEIGRERKRPTCGMCR